MESISTAQDWLNTLKTEGEFFRDGGYTPVSESTGAFLEALGRPDRSFLQRVVVGGSAGKGAVCSLIEQVLLGQRKTVGVLVSPHLQAVIERLRINGKLVSEDLWAESILDVRAASLKLAQEPTFYEANVIANILSAKKLGVEYLVLEVGCGGDFDSVHAVEGSRISVVTFIGDDHLDIFKTKENIARAKAGIFETPELIAAFSGEKFYQDILQSRSHLPIQWIKGIPSKMNKKISREVCEFVLGHGDFVMEKMATPARWEKIPSEIAHSVSINSPIILEGAHSESRFQYVLPRLHKESGKKIGILGLKKGTDMRALKTILPVFDEVVFTSIDPDIASKELYSAEDLYGYFQTGTYEEDPYEALKKADSMNGKIIVTGSLYLCGIIRNLFYPPEEIIAQQTEFPQVK